jgi:predicted transcriptional regulator
MQNQFQHLAKERRSKIQLYYDIISAIVEDSQNNDNVSPTRIQFKCNTSYDKLAKYLEEMKARQILEKEQFIKVTEKGMKFHQDYSKINELILEISNDIKAE